MRNSLRNYSCGQRETGLNECMNTNEIAEKKQGWIGVDLDGTLAIYDGWKGVNHIGAPVPAMLSRVKLWLSQGKDVRIFTARVDGGTVALNMGNDAGKDFLNIQHVRGIIESWCETHIGQKLPVTNQKDYGMIELWDDRAMQVIPNTGLHIAEATAQLQKELATARESALRDVIQPLIHKWNERYLGLKSIARRANCSNTHCEAETLKGCAKEIQSLIATPGDVRV